MLDLQMRAKIVVHEPDARVNDVRLDQIGEVRKISVLLPEQPRPVS